GGPAHVISHVVIDGGRMRSRGAAPGTSIFYLYRIELQELGGGPGGARFSSRGELGTDLLTGVLSFHVCPVAGGASPDTFADLGDSFDSVSGDVTIPASLQTFDFGVVAPGRFRLSYEFEFEASIPLLARNTGILFGEFSDPFSLSTHP